MDFTAKITSKGQLTLPAGLRKALGLAPGDRVVFSLGAEEAAGLVLEDSPDASTGGHVDGRRLATMSRAPDLIELAGTVPVPPRWRDADWSTIREEAWSRHTLEREARSQQSRG